MAPKGFGMSADGAEAFNGYVAGMTKGIKSDAYIGSALEYTHAILSDAFDLWMDSIATGNPEYAHVYEWPDEFHDYDQTVGQRSSRLWAHVLVGGNRSKAASFTFLPSTQPSPVDPILLQGDDPVKQGVHIFEWKAPAMEYGWPIEVTPQLSRFLAYVGNRGDQGSDAGWHHAKEQSDGNFANFSEGPVEFIAGGGVHNLKFTVQFLTFWKSMANKVFEQQVRPRLQGDMVDESELRKLIQKGNAKSAKTIKMKAQASAKSPDFAAASQAALKEVKQNQRDYLSEAAVRRYDNYGV